MSSWSPFNEDSYLVRASPFVFLKWLVIVEFCFALIPLLLIGIAQARASYESLELSRTFSYDLLLAVVLTSLQVFIIIGLFAAWYLPVYQISADQIVRRRGGLSADKTLIHPEQIQRIERKQGALGRRFDYATLQLFGDVGDEAVEMRNVPDPDTIQEMLVTLAAARRPAALLTPPASVLELISGGEGQHVEFKASLLWDHRQQRVNKALYVPVMKNLVGFMNSEGGFLLIGVNDDGEVLGLDADFQSMHKGNPDGFENKFNVSFNNMIGVEFRRFVDVSFPTLEERIICLLSVTPADEPVYLRNKGEEAFYIRAGNASQPLTMSKATRYIQSHFQNRSPA